MGRSFDRGGRSRKEREHGKRRAYQQAERDKDARQAMMQARHMKVVAVPPSRRQPVISAPIVPVVEIAPPVITDIPEMPVGIIAQKKSGFVSQFLSRFFGKSA
jgi:hypothetical protein